MHDALKAMNQLVSDGVIDHLRVTMFLEQDAVDRVALSVVLARYELLDRAERLPAYSLREADFPLMKIDEDKTAFNARAKASMREFLRSKTWVEKVESIERMNTAGKIAREGMRRELAERKEQEQATTHTESDLLRG